MTSQHAHTVDVRQPQSQQTTFATAGLKTLNAGFIGVGNFVSGNHLPNMAANPIWNIHSICDINDDNLQRAVAKYNPAFVTKDYRELLASPDIHAIVLGVRHSDHERFILEAAAAGKDIFVEKPMSMTQAESLSIINAVQKTGVRLMIGYNRRFGPLMLRAKELFKRQHAGKPAMVSVRAVDDRKLWPAWPFDLNDGGGKILCECCHFFDLLCWFLDAEPVRIFCEGYRDDENLVTIRFNDGSIATIISGGSGSVKYPKERFEVFCDSTTLVVEQGMELHAEGYDIPADIHWPLKKDHYPHVGQNMTPILAYRAKLRHWSEKGISPSEFERREYYSSMPGDDRGHYNEMDAFGKAILQGQPSPVDEIDGARATACCLAAIRSMEEGFISVNITPQDYWLDRKNFQARS